MSFPSIVFFLFFLLPLVGVLIWVMRQDKRKGMIGLIVLGLIVVLGVVYMFWRTGGQ